MKIPPHQKLSRLCALLFTFACALAGRALPFDASSIDEKLGERRFCVAPDLNERLGAALAARLWHWRICAGRESDARGMEKNGSMLPATRAELCASQGRENRWEQTKDLPESRRQTVNRQTDYLIEHSLEEERRWLLLLEPTTTYGVPSDRQK